MSTHPATKLLAALSTERTALLNFTALLEREQGMLVENSTDQLLELSEQKSSDAISLHKLAETRRNLLRQSVTPASGTPAQASPSSTRPSIDLSADAIRAWLKTHSPDALSIWQVILDLAERARQLNNTNGELIQMKLRHNQQILTVLSNAVNQANLYGPDGQTSFSPGSGRSLGSG